MSRCCGSSPSTQPLNYEALTESVLLKLLPDGRAQRSDRDSVSRRAVSVPVFLCYCVTVSGSVRMQVKWVVMSRSALLLLLILLHGCLSSAGGWRELKNDGTELIPEYTGHKAHPESEPQLQPFNNTNTNTMNEAKNGGKRQSANSPEYDSSELSCRELRSSRYITDGSCRSAKPVKELLCSGQCLPAHLMPNSIVRSKWWRTSSSDFRCIPAHYRMQRIKLQCPSGNSRTYKMRVVTSCKCKRFTRQHNQSDAKEGASPNNRRNKKLIPFQQERGRSREPALSSNSY